MSKLYFKFGAMGSSKTANALMTVFNYEEKGKTVLILKPSIDDRDDEIDETGRRIGVLKSRIGLSNIANVIREDVDLVAYVEEELQQRKIDVIVCDECQFFTEKQIDDFKYIAAYKDIPVLCFGLRSDFRTKLFPGSKRLFEIADSISEVKSVCKCGKKAIVNARFDENGTIVTEGKQVEIGGNEKYESMCWECWNDKKVAKKDSAIALGIE